MKFGWKRDLPDYRDYLYSQHKEFLSAPSLPKNVDLRTVLPPVKDQGQIGSCVSNGLALALEFIQLKAIKDQTPEPEIFKPFYDPISRLFIYYNARVIDGDVQYDNGTQIRSGIMGIRTKGICEESVWPYGTKYLFTAPGPDAYSEGLQHKVLAGYRIDNTNIVQMKSCLAVGYPFVIGVSLFSSFESIGSNGLVPMPQRREAMIGGHCMTCVGYDDAHQVFMIANSWSTGWGDQGFCYMPYAYLTNPNLSADFWTIRKEGNNG